MIRRFQALNYRCLRYVDVPLDRLHVLVLPDLESIRVVERPEDLHAYLMLRYKTGVEIPSWTASDGTLRFLALTLLAYLPDSNEVYVLEEPENGVHPLALDAVYDSLSSVYESQVLVATSLPGFLEAGEARRGSLLCEERGRGYRHRQRG